MSATQGTVTCAVMANTLNCSRVIEVACGPGFNSSVIANSYLNRNKSALVCCDFSKEMVRNAKEHFENESDFTKVQDNLSHFELDINFNLTNE